MIYQINYKEVLKDEFEKELNMRLENYKPYSQYYPQVKEEVLKDLKEDRRVRLFEYDKRFKDKLIITKEITFIACEEEILEMAEIVARSEYDACDEDDLRIAVALWKAGYRKVN